MTPPVVVVVVVPVLAAVCGSLDLLALARIVGPGVKFLKGGTGTRICFADCPVRNFVYGSCGFNGVWMVMRLNVDVERSNGTWDNLIDSISFRRLLCWGLCLRFLRGCCCWFCGMREAASVARRVRVGEIGFVGGDVKDGCMS